MSVKEMRTSINEEQRTFMGQFDQLFSTEGQPSPAPVEEGEVEDDGG